MEKSGDVVTLSLEHFLYENKSNRGIGMHLLTFDECGPENVFIQFFLRAENICGIFILRSIWVY